MLSFLMVLAMTAGMHMSFAMEHEDLNKAILMDSEDVLMQRFACQNLDFFHRKTNFLTTIADKQLSVIQIVSLLDVSIDDYVKYARPPRHESMFLRFNMVSMKVDILKVVLHNYPEIYEAFMVAEKAHERSLMEHATKNRRVSGTLRE